jgi:DNA-binding transcriptional MerR regulator
MFHLIIHLTTGAAAKKMGVTIRTLHHYDELGLVRPSKRSRGGYRLYAEADMNRLEIVLMLRKLQFSLGEIRKMFRNRKFSFARTVQVHLRVMKSRARREHELYERLERIARFLGKRKEASLEEIITLLNSMSAPM